MRIFISWSGKEVEQVGSSLKLFLERTFPGHVHGFLSSEDIAPGERFAGVIATGLESATLGILLVTPDNQNSPWLLFEAGALAAKTATGSVIPVLLGLGRADLHPPLSQFQNVVGADRAGFLSICARIRSNFSMPDTSFDTLFNAEWPELEAAIMRMAIASTGDEPPSRSVEEMVAEVLLTVNSLAISATRKGTRPDSPGGKVYQLLRSIGIEDVGKWFSSTDKNGDKRLTVRLAGEWLTEGQIRALAGEAARLGVSLRLHPENGLVDLDGAGGYTVGPPDADDPAILSV